jgi:hypothetical protein
MVKPSTLIVPGGKVVTHPAARTIFELLIKVVVWLITAVPAYLGIQLLTDLPRPLLRGLVEPEQRAASFLPAIYQSAIAATMIAVACAFAWWIIAQAWKPASPLEVLRFRKIWWLLSLVFTGLIVSVFYYLVLKDAGPVTVGTRVLFLVGYVFFSWLFFVASLLVFSPLSVISEIPGGSFVSKRKWG